VLAGVTAAGAEVGEVDGEAAVDDPSGNRALLRVA
jgi:hypothetical protein